MPLQRLVIARGIAKAHGSPWRWRWAADDRQIWLFQRRHDLFVPVDGQRNEEQC